MKLVATGFGDVYSIAFIDYFQKSHRSYRKAVTTKYPRKLTPQGDLLQLDNSPTTQLIGFNGCFAWLWLWSRWSTSPASRFSRIWIWNVKMKQTKHIKHLIANNVAVMMTIAYFVSFKIPCAIFIPIPYNFSASLCNPMKQTFLPRWSGYLYSKRQIVCLLKNYIIFFFIIPLAAT